MSDLIERPEEGQNQPEFTVTELSQAVKRTIESAFGFVRIRGELGRVSRPRSGHIYLDLKDDKSVISGVIWKGVSGRLAIQPEEGMEVIATGRLTTFAGQSKYQLVIEDIKPAGAGALMAMLEKRKAMLAAEGLFAPERKQPLPYLPEVIGVVTSPSGAVIRDILHRLRDRFPRKVLIWPVAVQGEKCAPDVARAIAGFNALEPGGSIPRPDLIIVARGGGSLEDLWGFNEEVVVRAAAASQIPLISAVGHETDTTLIDYAADRRAPTPTAAAEMAVPVRMELFAWLADQEARLRRALLHGMGQRQQRLRDLARALPRGDRLLDGPRQRLDDRAMRLARAIEARGRETRLRLDRLTAALRPGQLTQLVLRKREALSPFGTRLELSLRRGLEARNASFARQAERLNPDQMHRDIARRRRDLQQITARLGRAAQGQIVAERRKLAGLARMHDTLGYQQTLSRGFAVVRGADGLLTSADAARRAGLLSIEFSDGTLDALPQTEGAKPRAKPSRGSDGGQGSLF